MKGKCMYAAHLAKQPKTEMRFDFSLQIHRVGEILKVGNLAV